MIIFDDYYLMIYMIDFFKHHEWLFHQSRQHTVFFITFRFPLM